MNDQFVEFWKACEKGDEKYVRENIMPVVSEIGRKIEGHTCVTIAMKNRHERIVRFIISFVHKECNKTVNVTTYAPSTFGEDWITRVTKATNKAFSGCYGEDWPYYHNPDYSNLVNPSKNKAFCGVYEAPERDGFSEPLDLVKKSYTPVDERGGVGSDGEFIEEPDDLYQNNNLFLCLPLEIFDHIFSFVEQLEVIFVFSKVCHLFNVIIMEKSLDCLSTIELCPSNYLTDFTSISAKNDTSEVTEEMFLDLTSRFDLKNFELSLLVGAQRFNPYCQREFFLCDVAEILGRNCPSLTSLKLKSCSFRIDYLEKLENLSSCHFQDCVITITKDLCFPVVKSFRVSEFEVLNVVDGQDDNTSLRLKITLPRCENFEYYGEKKFGNVFVPGTELQKCAIEHSNHWNYRFQRESSNPLKEFAEGSWQNVADLRLHNVHVDTSKVIEILDNATENLRVLSFTTSLEVKKIDVVSLNEKYMKNLRELHFNFTNFVGTWNPGSDEMLKVLLDSCKKLEVFVYRGGSGITIQGIVNIMSTLRNLKVMKLPETPIDLTEFLRNYCLLKSRNQLEEVELAFEVGKLSKLFEFVKTNQNEIRNMVSFRSVLEKIVDSFERYHLCLEKEYKQSRFVCGSFYSPYQLDVKKYQDSLKCEHFYKTEKDELFYCRKCEKVMESFKCKECEELGIRYLDWVDYLVKCKFCLMFIPYSKYHDHMNEFHVEKGSKFETGDFISHTTHLQNVLFELPFYKKKHSGNLELICRNCNLSVNEISACPQSSCENKNCHTFDWIDYPVSCITCKEQVQLSEYYEHVKLHNEFRPRFKSSWKCPIKNCGSYQIKVDCPYGKINDHLIFECEKNVISCPSCREDIALMEWESHSSSECVRKYRNIFTWEVINERDFRENVVGKNMVYQETLSDEKVFLFSNLISTNGYEKIVIEGELTCDIVGIIEQYEEGGVEVLIRNPHEVEVKVGKLVRKVVPKITQADQKNTAADAEILVAHKAFENWKQSEEGWAMKDPDDTVENNEPFAPPHPDEYYEPEPEPLPLDDQLEPEPEPEPEPLPEADGSKDGDGGKERKARAIYDFESSDSEEISIREGEFVFVLKDVGEWYFIRNSQNQEGYVPASYVKL